MPPAINLDPRLKAMVGTIRAEGVTPRPAGNVAPPYPFVTISRPAGAPATGLSHRLVERLNQIDPADPPWSAWDRELVEKVSTENRIPNELIETLEESRQTWFGEILAGLSNSPGSMRTSEFAIYRRVALTVRGLALSGKTVIVGRAGVFITAGISGGVHVRLVAPLDYRIRQMARLRRITERKARAEINRIERSRDAFYHRYWPGKQRTPEAFTVTFNMAEFDIETLTESLLPFIRAASAKLVAK